MNQALAQFGTDFQMMCYLLPGRTRAQIRTKFNREERINPEKIKDYLIGKKQKIGEFCGRSAKFWMRV